MNIDDYMLIDATVGIQGPPLGSAAGALEGNITAAAPVPEPILPAGMFILAFVSARRRRRS